MIELGQRWKNRSTGVEVLIWRRDFQLKILSIKYPSGRVKTYSEEQFLRFFKFDSAAKA